MQNLHLLEYWVSYAPLSLLETLWKGKYRSMDNTKIGKERRKSYQKSDQITSCRFNGVFTYIYNFLIEKDICDGWNVLLTLFVCHSSRDLFIFSVRVSSFFSYFCVITAWWWCSFFFWLIGGWNSRYVSMTGMWRKCEFCNVVDHLVCWLVIVYTVPSVKLMVCFPGFTSE